MARRVLVGCPESRWWAATRLLHGGVIGELNCAAWIRRRGGGANRLLLLYDRGGTATSLLILDLFACVRARLRTPVACRTISVHPGSDKFVWATAKGCSLFNLSLKTSVSTLLHVDYPPLQSVGHHGCLAFSTDDAKFATGGEECFYGFVQM